MAYLNKTGIELNEGSHSQYMDKIEDSIDELVAEEEMLEPQRKEHSKLASELNDKLLNRLMRARKNVAEGGIDPCIP